MSESLSTKLARKLAPKFEEGERNGGIDVGLRKVFHHEDREEHEGGIVGSHFLRKLRGVHHPHGR